MTMPLTHHNNSSDRFLVIGVGSERRGDEAAGPQVARAVENWQLQSVRAIAVPQLTPQLAPEIANTDYVIFVESCSDRCSTSTVQIEPIVGNIQSRRLLTNRSHYLNPWTLLSLSKQCYGVSPQSWLLQVPVEHFNPEQPLSKTALNGCDRAIRTISQFIKTYQHPVYTLQKHYTAPSPERELSCA